MFKLKNRDLHISRTEEGNLTVKCKKALDPASIAELKIYDIDSLDEGYLKKIDGTISEDGLTVVFSFEADDTNIEESNEILDYWYDIRLGSKIIGYDESKARHLYIYPVGSDSEKQ